MNSLGRLLVGQVRASRVRALLSSSGHLGITQLWVHKLVAAVSNSSSLTAAGIFREHQFEAPQYGWAGGRGVSSLRQQFG